MSQSDVDNALPFLLWVETLTERTWKDLYSDPGFVKYLNEKKAGPGGAGVFWSRIGSRDKYNIAACYQTHNGKAPQNMTAAAAFYSGIYGALGLWECMEAFGESRGKQLFTVFERHQRNTVKFYAELTPNERAMLIDWYNEWNRRMYEHAEDYVNVQ